MSDDRLVRLDVDAAVATVTIDRAQRHNSLVPELLASLIGVFRKIDELPGIGAVVLRAVGPSFSTGGDIAAMAAAGETIGEYADTLVGHLNETIVAIIECEHPVIVAVDGQVTGGAIGLVLAADVVVVTERASFTPWYVDVGFSPDGGWTALLPALIGRNRALAVQLLNDTIDAQAAVAWGLAHTLTSRDRLDDTVADLARRICAKRAGSVRETRALLRPADYRARLDDERRRFVARITSDEARRGIDRFMKR